MQIPRHNLPAHYREMLASWHCDDVFAVTAPPRTPYADTPATRGWIRLGIASILEIDEDAQTLTYRDAQGIARRLDHFDFLARTELLEPDMYGECAGCFGMLADSLRMFSLEGTDKLLLGYDTLNDVKTIPTDDLFISTVGLRNKSQDGYIFRWENACGIFPTDPIAVVTTITIVLLDDNGEPSFVDINANLDWWSRLGF